MTAFLPLKDNPMTRDYSQFMPTLKTAKKSETKPNSTLTTLGWNNFFNQQVSLQDTETHLAVRVMSVHRNRLHIKGENVDANIPNNINATTGDWLFLNPKHPVNPQILSRKSVMARKAAGTGREVQLIAANIDTAFIVTSCNHDFSIARLERYLALILQAKITPVIILTKADLTESLDPYIQNIKEISSDISIVALNALKDDVHDQLSSWCRRGHTLAFVGSSGVGKSTLINSLAQSDTLKTQDIREDDSKGRHTTTHRQLIELPQGFLVLDTPGMRELQLAHADEGIASVFEDLDRFSKDCKFNDCQHGNEPGCNIQKRLKSGEITPERFERWLKLKREEVHNSSSLLERRQKDKAFGKMVRNTIQSKKDRQGKI